MANLPGRPDFANGTRAWAVFVHGCFWHQHKECKHATVPKSNREFWESKFAANSVRDRRVARDLRARGYAVITVWECETRHAERLARRLSKVLEPHRVQMRKP